MMTIYHTILEVTHPPTPERVKAVHVVLENRAKVFYPQGYQPDEFLPSVSADVEIEAELEGAFDHAVSVDGLDRSCIEARRALAELFEKIGSQL
jgi:hypothetical protein